MIFFLKKPEKKFKSAEKGCDNGIKLTHEDMRRWSGTNGTALGKSNTQTQHFVHHWAIFIGQSISNLRR